MLIVLSICAARREARNLAAKQIIWMALLGSAWMLADALGENKLQTLGSRLNAEILWGWPIWSWWLLLPCFSQARAQRYVTAYKVLLIYAMERFLRRCLPCCFANGR